MLGNMMHRPLNTVDILKYAEEIHGDRRMFSALPDGSVHRTTYRDTAQRCRQLAKALLAMGVQPGDRVATLAWNGYRHLELYYAITGVGAVCHTINPRLSSAQLVYIIRHAEDRVLFVDCSLVPTLLSVIEELPSDITFVVMKQPEDDFQYVLENAIFYEDLLSDQDDAHEWASFDENTACGLCYTSGTTGNPKGALYSHRATVLHAMITCLAFPNVFQPGRRLLPVVPLFHVNAWGTPFSALMSGAEIVFPGQKLDGESLYRLMDRTKTWSAWGVPTIWIGLLAEIEKRGSIPEGFAHIVSGGAAASTQMITTFEELGIDVAHSWGMTEMSPIGSHGQLFAPQSDQPLEARLTYKATQGRRMFGVDMKIVDEEGARQPHDNEAVGELYVRGNTIVESYFNDAEASEKALDAEGWFATGDVARISPDGFLSITDRAKDLVKSGGEWISSIDIENAALQHPDLVNCAVIGAYHPKWDERPLLIAVAKEGVDPDRDGILKTIGDTVAKWQIPDDIVFVDQLPMTATGKISKITLRSEYRFHLHPEPAQG